MHCQRVLEIQAALFAEDVTPPSDASTWSDEALTIYFESGGEPQDGRRPCMELRASLLAESDVWPPGEGFHDSHWDSEEACGIEIHQVEEQSCKGMGAFATRDIRAGEVVGIYKGEHLTVAAYKARHERQRAFGSCSRCRGDDDDLERTMRLSKLPQRAPMGGARNGGAYVVCLASRRLSEMASAEEPETCVMYVDAEDPNRSNWCRFVNHADGGDPACNLSLHTAAAPEPRAWLEACRDIRAGEELNFDYGPRYDIPRSSFFSSRLRECSCCGWVCILGLD